MRLNRYASVACPCLIGVLLCLPVRADETIVRNARIWTNDPAMPEAGSMLFRDGVIVAVGSEKVIEDKRQSHSAKEIDARGARILPGLIDSHLHLVSGGLQLSRLNLRDVPDKAAFAAAVAKRAKQTPKNQWILGGRWSTDSWADPATPNKNWIDAVTPDHPVLLDRMDGHGALANSQALKLAGIDAHGPPDPPGGVIERDPKSGAPTGILKDTAIDLIEKLIPPPTDAELDAGLAAAMKHANAHGLTCVHTMSSWREIEAMRRTRDERMLTLRIRAIVQEDDWRPLLAQLNKFQSDEWLTVIGVKQYADGSLGSRTAFMATPYTDNPSDKKTWCGSPREGLLCPGGDCSTTVDGASYFETCKVLMREGLFLAIHAIGDKANNRLLDIYQRALESQRNQCSLEGSPLLRDRNSGPVSTRLRIEHAQHLLPADIPRFAKLGVIASMQPLHKADDARYAEKAIGPERCKTSYAFRSLLDAGAHVAFGSDWPVVSLDPFLGIHAAVTGESLDGKIFVPEQNITVEQALRCYTSEAAYAAGDEKTLGRIAPGMAADFVILEDDVLTVPPPALKKIRVRQTYVAGQARQPSN